MGKCMYCKKDFDSEDGLQNHDCEAHEKEMKRQEKFCQSIRNPLNWMNL